MFGSLRPGYLVLFCIMLIEFSIAVWLGVAPLWNYFRVGNILATLPIWLMLPLLWFGRVGLEITRRRVDRPIAAMWQVVYRNRYWLIRGCLLLALMFPISRGFNSYKSAIPDLIPFYLDPFLISADNAIFGMDAWRITHAFIGPLGTLVIDRVYALWALGTIFLVGWLCFTKNIKLQLQGLISYVLCWTILGNYAAAAFASVGPCFYDDFYHDNHFNPLMQKIYAADEAHPLLAVMAMRYLLRTIGTDSFGASISAMPSLQAKDGLRRPHIFFA